MAAMRPENQTMLGTFNAKIFNLDSKELEETKWTELENVRYFMISLRDIKKNLNGK